MSSRLSSLLSATPLRVGGVLEPVGQAVAAEAGQIHQIDVLDVGARPQMLDQAPESGPPRAPFWFLSSIAIAGPLGSDPMSPLRDQVGVPSQILP